MGRPRQRVEPGSSSFQPLFHDPPSRIWRPMFNASIASRILADAREPERVAWPAALHGERVRRTRERLGWSPTDRVYHTSVSGFHRPAAGQVF